MERDEILRMIKEHDLRPIRGRGQNFLVEPKVVRAMADAAGVSAGDKVLEIGPGPGILTEELVGRGARVLAVELDPKLARIVRERVASERLEVLQGDILDFGNDGLAERLGAEEEGYKVVANLPYSITSDALRKFIAERPRPASFTVMVQREVADRVTAAPPKMSLLSVVMQSYGDARKVMNVPASYFHPSPRVDSAVLHVRVLPEEELEERLSGTNPERLLGIAKIGFAAPRKQLKNTLSGRFPKAALDDAFTSAGVDPAARPERLSVSDWARLCDVLIH